MKSPRRPRKEQKHIALSRTCLQREHSGRCGRYVNLNVDYSSREVESTASELDAFQRALTSMPKNCDASLFVARAHRKAHPPQGLNVSLTLGSSRAERNGRSEVDTSLLVNGPRWHTKSISKNRLSNGLFRRWRQVYLFSVA